MIKCFKSSTQDLISQFHELGLIPVIGCELEFYISESKNIELLNNILGENIKLLKEVGLNQFELVFKPSNDIVTLLEMIEVTKSKIEVWAQEEGLNVSFSAKPFANEPGSAFHIHLNMVDVEGKNAFNKKCCHQESDYLLYSVGGLLQSLENYMHIFAPNENSYERFRASMTSPSTISWGNNNRTTAIRIPPSTLSPRRIEHRVSGADVDVFAAVYAVLEGAYNGICNKISPPPQIYGNAFDEHYMLKPLIRLES